MMKFGCEATNHEPQASDLKRGEGFFLGGGGINTTKLATLLANNSIIGHGQIEGVGRTS